MSKNIAFKILFEKIQLRAACVIFLTLSVVQLAAAATEPFPPTIDAEANDEFSKSIDSQISIDGTDYSVRNLMYIDDYDGDGSPERVISPREFGVPLPENIACDSLYIIPSSANIDSAITAIELEEYLQYTNVPRLISRFDDNQFCTLGDSEAIGDLNGDGLEDLIIYGFEEATVLFGVQQGTVVDASVLDGTNGFSITGFTFNFDLGDLLDEDLKVVGDVNGDGLQDLAIRRNFPNNPNLRSSINIFAGRASGFPSNLNVDEESDAEYELTVFSTETQLRVAPLGDVNGDGISDMVIGGGPFFSLQDIAGGFDPDSIREMFVNHVVYGATEFSVQNSNDINFLDTQKISGCSFPLCSLEGVGDINNDGYDDVATSRVLRSMVPEVDDEAQMQVIPGTAEGLPSVLDSTNSIEIQGRNGIFSTSPPIDGIGFDLNSDGIDDLLISTLFTSSADTLFTEVYFGSTDIFTTLSEITAEQLDVGSELLNGLNGFSITSLDSFNSRRSNGDFNGDGVNDIAFLNPRVLVFGRSSDAIEPVEPADIIPPVTLDSIRYSATAAEIMWQRQSFDGAVPQYEVRRNNEIIATVSGTSFFDDSLPNNERFEYSVVTVVDGARSVEAVVDITAFTFVENPPGDNDQSEPSNTDGGELGLRIDVYAPNTAELFWNRLTAPGGAVQYELFKDDVLVTSTDGTSFFDVFFSDSVQIDYEVVAFSAAGDLLAIESLTTNSDSSGSNTSNDDLLELQFLAYSATAGELFWNRLVRSDGQAVSYDVTRDGELIATTTGTSFFDPSFNQLGGAEYEVSSTNADEGALVSSVIIINGN